MVRVKICGITSLEDALVSLKAGCDALGFMFYKKSPRYIAPGMAKEIIRQLPADIIKIGVFVNAEEGTVKRIAKLCNLDMLQFHGNESAAFCQRFKGIKIIKAFRIKDKLNLEKISRYKTFAYLFDTFKKSKIGGTGKIFNWKLLARDINNFRIPIFLSGGLNQRNVKRAIETLHPDWVDASSSLEIKPGEKDPKKVREFIEAAKKENYEKVPLLRGRNSG